MNNGELHDHGFIRSNLLKSKFPVALHVDDESDFNFLLKLALENRVDVVGATTVKDARCKIFAQKYNLIILDISLPDGSGLSLLSEIQKSQNETTPIMILSAKHVYLGFEDRISEVVVKSTISEHQIFEKIVRLATPFPLAAKHN